MNKAIFFLWVFVCLVAPVFAQYKGKDIVLENSNFRLVIGSNGIAKSLQYKPKNIECLARGEGIAAFAATQERPYSNEVKLAHLNKRTTYNADTVYKKGDKIYVGFETIPYDAVLQVKTANDYIRFELVDFIIPPEAYPSFMKLTPPPATEITLLKLPVKNRKYFGEWLNVSWDENVCVNVLATDEFAMIDNEKRKGYKILKGDVFKEIKFKGSGVALIVSDAKTFLDKVETIENDYNLPKGVKNRRSQYNNMSYYWIDREADDKNIERHLKYAKQGGFRSMLFYYPAFTKENGEYKLLGDYDWNAGFANGEADLKKLLTKAKSNGIVPGFHVLHTHIGKESRYITPVPDYRINLVRRFNLSKNISKEDSVIYVEQNPEGCVMADSAKVLRLGKELIYYKNYCTIPPYYFTGCKRGIYKTNAQEANRGDEIGLMDVSEFLANSFYIDQKTGLQDEIAAKISNIYNTGFQFIYFDGSEGVNPPFGHYVSAAQYKVYKRLKPEPLFAEGAARTHFGWHILSGGNAFDAFPAEYQREAIKKHQAEEAPRMKQDFTRINFGWLAYTAPNEKTIGTQPDVLEYLTSKAAAWDCPISIQMILERLDAHPRTADNLEVMRRWEDVRKINWLTETQKKLLQKTDKEYTLLLNEQGKYELQFYEQITNVAGHNRDVRAFIFNRKGQWNVVYWHISANKNLDLPIPAKHIRLFKDLSVNEEALNINDERSLIPVGDKRFIKFNNLSKEQIIKAFANAKIVN